MSYVFNVLPNCDYHSVRMVLYFLKRYGNNNYYSTKLLLILKMEFMLLDSKN